jgi:hypothetical protein
MAFGLNLLGKYKKKRIKKKNKKANAKAKAKVMARWCGIWGRARGGKDAVKFFYFFLIY